MLGAVHRNSPASLVGQAAVCGGGYRCPFLWLVDAGHGEVARLVSRGKIVPFSLEEPMQTEDILMCPGPNEIADRVLRAMIRPAACPVYDEFQEFYEQTL